jgi:hypothetical protein
MQSVVLAVRIMMRPLDESRSMPSMQLSNPDRVSDAALLSLGLRRLSRDDPTPVAAGEREAVRQGIVRELGRERDDRHVQAKPRREGFDDGGLPAARDTIQEQIELVRDRAPLVIVL